MEKIKNNLKLFIKQENNFLDLALIRSVQEINQKFKQINDIYTFHNLIEEMSGQISKMVYQKDKFDKFMRRLIEAICFALEKYAYDFSRTSFLVDTLNLIKKNWKQVLAKEFAEIGSQINQTRSRFLYALSKNQYMFYVIKGSNVLIEKQIIRLIKISSINIKSLFYVKKCYLRNVWAKIYDEMIYVANQTQNQTYLKIQLLIEFLRHTLYQVNFCTGQSDFATLYQRLFKLAGYAFRLIKKFYSIEIFPFINTIKQIIYKGIQIYREIIPEFPNKIRYLSNMMKLFEEKKPKKRKGVKVQRGTLLFQTEEERDIQPLNPKSYAIKLALRLLTSWKKIKNQKNKEIHLKEKYLSMTEKLKSRSTTRKNTEEQEKKENNLVSIEKKQAQLKNKAQKSVPVYTFNIMHEPLLLKVKLRKEIEDQIDKEFGKLKYLKNCTNIRLIIGEKRMKKSLSSEKGSLRSLRSISMGRKKSFSLKQALGIKPKILPKKQDNQQKDINIEEYKEKLNLCRKQISTHNNIKLYQSGKRSLLPHGGQKLVTSTVSSSYGQSGILLAPNQKQKLRL